MEDEVRVPCPSLFEGRSFLTSNNGALIFLVLHLNRINRLPRMFAEGPAEWRRGSADSSTSHRRSLRTAPTPGPAETASLPNASCGPVFRQRAPGDTPSR